MVDTTSYIIAFAIGIGLAIYLYFKHIFNYWKSKGVYTEPISIPFGTAKDFFLGKVSLLDYFTRQYKHLRAKNLKFAGDYIGPNKQLIIVDMDLIKRVIITDFVHFASHGFDVDEKLNPLGAHLFNLTGARWKNMRTKLTPTFTSGKMKMMFDTFVACTVGLKELLEAEEKSGEPIDIKEVMARFTTDIIGSCAFGLECNSLKDPDAEFRRRFRRQLTPDKLDKVKMLLLRFLPKYIVRLLKFRFIGKEMEDFFVNAVKDTIEYREKNNVYRKDFMHLLLQLKNLGKVTDDERIMNEDGTSKETLTLLEVAAQCFVFFAAGFETSSTALSYALYELSVHQDIQEKLRQEINSVLEKYDNKLTYDAVKDMHYLDKVLNETLRMHPPIGILPRGCTKEYTIPDTNVVIEPNTPVIISIIGVHMDPEYYPDPEKFDPERFSEENVAKRPHLSFLPFGEGPRACIGLRFGVLQSKVALITVLRNFKVTLNEKTKTPLKSAGGNLINAVKDAILVNVESIC